MKRYIAIGLFLVVFLTGCTDHTVVPEVGDFTFELPDGYAISNTTDKNCSIIRGEDSTAVGGIEVTELKLKDLKDDETENIMLYLQNDFHMTNNIEYIASHWGNQNPIVTVNLKKHGDHGEESAFTHYFFEKDSGVYHMWLDMNETDSEIERKFISITGVD